MGVQPVGCHCKAVASQALGLFMWEATLELHSRTCALGEGLATPLFSASLIMHKARCMYVAPASSPRPQGATGGGGGQSAGLPWAVVVCVNLPHSGDGMARRRVYDTQTLQRNTWDEFSCKRMLSKCQNPQQQDPQASR